MKRLGLKAERSLSDEDLEGHFNRFSRLRHHCENQTNHQCSASITPWPPLPGFPPHQAIPVPVIHQPPPYRPQSTSTPPLLPIVHSVSGETQFGTLPRPTYLPVPPAMPATSAAPETMVVEPDVRFTLNNRAIRSLAEELAPRIRQLAPSGPIPGPSGVHVRPGPSGRPAPHRHQEEEEEDDEEIINILRPTR